MRYYLIFFIVFQTFLFAEIYLVNTAVLNMFSKPSKNTDVVSQTIYGESVDLMEKIDNDWGLIQTKDQYTGYAELQFLFQNENYHPNCEVKSFFAQVYAVPGTMAKPPLMTLPYGTKIVWLEKQDYRWNKIRLIDGTLAWIQSGDIHFQKKNKSIEEMLSFSEKFLGLPYIWGGASSFGYDCSGFVQMLYREMGISIPRDSRDQALSDALVKVEKENLLKGDLIFFGEERIIHVGIYLGENKFIHSGVRDDFPGIMISDLNTTRYPFKDARRLKNQDQIFLEN